MITALEHVAEPFVALIMVLFAGLALHGEVRTRRYRRIKKLRAERAAKRRKVTHTSSHELAPTADERRTA
jgi:hypothetical protein